MTLIDVHSHFVPEHFPPAPPEESRWPCMCHHGAGQADVMIAGKNFRSVDARSWAATRRIDDMARAGVTCQVLSPMPELLSYWFAAEHALDFSRYINEQIATVVAQHPQHFRGMGMVPLQDPEMAAGLLAEIKSAGLSAVEVGSNVNGRYLGDPLFDEFLKEAQRLDLALFVHALHPIGAERLQAYAELVPFAAFPLDTALCAMTLIRAGVPERMPDLRVGFSHGGGAVIPLAHRMDKGAQVTAQFQGELSRPPSAYAREFFFDSLVYDVGYLRYLCEFAPGQVFCGTDYPYLIMDGEPQTVIVGAGDTPDLRYGAAQKFLRLD